MITNAQRSFFRWTWFRAWFPVLFFLAYWINSYLQYHFGLLIREKLALETYVYLWSSMLLFVIGYAQGLGRQHIEKIMVPSEGYAQNIRIFKKLNWLLWITFIGVVGLVADRLLSGAGSIEKTIHETAYVRQEFVENTTLFTTISMAVYSFSFVAYAAYFLAVAVGFRVKRSSHLLVYGSFLLLCFVSFLSVNRGNFFSIVTYILFFVIYVKGSRLKELLFSNQYQVLRLIGICFIATALVYFFFISRYRSTEDGLVSTASYYRDIDRYGVYRLNFDEHNVTAFLLTYTYMSEGYQYIDAFLKHAPAFAFRPSMLVGSRVMRQVWRFFPDDHVKELSAVIVGNQWRRDDGLSVYGWPTVWGWNLSMFGYVGGPLFMFLYGWWLGFCSGQFLKYAKMGALLISFANYSILMNSYNSLGGDIPHQVAIAVGVWLLLSDKTRHQGC